MEVVSISNLVSLETKNTIFNMIMPWQANRIWIWSKKIYKYEAICSFMIAEMWKSTLRNTHTQNSKIKTNQQ